MEATEFLLKSGHVPKRTFYIAFGHDEEVGKMLLHFQQQDTVIYSFIKQWYSFTLWEYMKKEFCRSKRECQPGMTTSTSACKNNSTTKIMAFHPASIDNFPNSKPRLDLFSIVIRHRIFFRNLFIYLKKRKIL